MCVCVCVFVSIYNFVMKTYVFTMGFFTGNWINCVDLYREVMLFNP